MARRRYRSSEGPKTGLAGRGVGFFKSIETGAAGLGVYGQLSLKEAYALLAYQNEGGSERDWFPHAWGRDEIGIWYGAWSSDDFAAMLSTDDRVKYLTIYLPSAS